MKFKALFFIIGIGVILPKLQAEVVLAPIFNDNMVLQRQKAVPVWGRAKAREVITVTFKGQTIETTADEDGHWQVQLNPMDAATEASTLTVSGENQIALTNVLVGEVWLGSGQSNMSWKLSSPGLYETEIAESKQYPLIRLFSVPKPTSAWQTWNVAAPETVKDFSAVAYFFGLALHKKLKVPIGLIQSSVGSTEIEAWMSIDSLLALELPTITSRIQAESETKKNFDPQQLEQKLLQWQQAVQTAREGGEKPPHRPKTLWHPNDSPWIAGNLYQHMIEPIIPYAIQGVIWYQGESNAQHADQYQQLFPALIHSWRQAWQADEFAFLYVQLANFMALQTQPVEDADWPFLREAQLMTLALPNTAMVSVIDLGEAQNIHPPRKQEVGERLARAARALTYGEDIVYSGPLYDAMKIEGDKIKIIFKYSDNGLVAQGDKLKGFAIAGKDRQWFWAEAKIDQSNTVIVHAPQLEAPVAVRYSWANNPVGNLYNQAGLPASPFRTDNWEQESQFWRFLRRHLPWF